MDPATLASAASVALVAAMATDTWDQARAAAAEWWRRVHPGRAEAVTAELDEVREELLAARRLGDTAGEEELAGECRHRLLRLLRQDPGLVGEMRRVLDEVLAPALEPEHQQRVRLVVMQAQADGPHGQANVAGRDINVSKP